MKQKNKLTPKQRAQIIDLRFNHGWTLKQIGDRFNVTSQNISYYIRQHKKKGPSHEKPKPKTLSQELDPIQFRINKLAEVGADIMTAREEKIIHSLPTFHKLHINIHNELRELITANKDIQNLDSESLKAEIIETILNLPPILKTQIIQELDLLSKPNVIQLKAKK